MRCTTQSGPFSTASRTPPHAPTRFASSAPSGDGQQEEECFHAFNLRIRDIVLDAHPQGRHHPSLPSKSIWCLLFQVVVGIGLKPIQRFKGPWRYGALSSHLYSRFGSTTKSSVIEIFPARLYRSDVRCWGCHEGVAGGTGELVGGAPAPPCCSRCALWCFSWWLSQGDRVVIFMPIYLLQMITWQSIIYVISIK